MALGIWVASHFEYRNSEGDLLIREGHVQLLLVRGTPVGGGQADLVRTVMVREVRSTPPRGWPFHRAGM